MRAACCSFLLVTLAAVLHAAPRTVTFARDIAPIVYQNCAPCHRPGESAPFSLLSYQDVRRHASQIADVTKRRYMPPWLPQAGYGAFQDERRLTDEQIALIQKWVAQGAQPGSLAEAPQPPKFSSEWQLGPPDLILHVDHPYHLDAGGSEIFWNFILPVPIKQERWVRAIEVRPGNAKVFHHANVVIDRSGASRRQEKIPGFGFPGMDLAVEENSFDPDGHFLSWKPGSPPVVEPDGMAWRATPGMDLILNVHLRPTGKEEIVNPEIGLYFTDKPQTKYPMLVQLEHDGALDIKPGDRDFLISDDFHVPLDLNVLEIYPHAHYLAKLMEGYATLPDGTRKWLVRIPDWDLNWQGVYRLKEPLFLPRGSVISMRYHYDNSAANIRNPNRPPKEVKAGVQATDEMGHLWLQVLPVADGDQRMVLEDELAQERLRKYPDDFGANFNMGDVELSKGDAAQAIGFFEKATKAEPRSPVAASELGVALYTAGRLPEAEEQFKKALLIDASYTDARFNLASVEAESGEFEASVSDFRGVLTDRADYPKAQERLVDVLFAWGDQLAKSGNNEDAILRYRQALTYAADNVELHTSLGAALARLGKTSDARYELEAALKINPNFEPARKILESLSR
ncbi:MAG TPA: tetratricopeptide repeat protein [Bryobacteraceae bacterium]|nr:tetratricopeptide repeat protein [Bryobacteraceae bacterium]